MYDENTGKIQKGRDGQPELRSGFGVGVCPPRCMTGLGCPKGTPENQKDLNEISRNVLDHYLECKAIGSFPDDPIVKRNASMIREVEEMWDRYKAEKRHNDLLQMIAHSGAKNTDGQ